MTDGAPTIGLDAAATPSRLLPSGRRLGTRRRLRRVARRSPKQAAIDNQIDRLNLLTPSNPHLLFPHSSQVRRELRELRCHYGSELYRILYRRSRNLIVLLHMFAKTPARSPSERFGSPRSAGKTSRRGWTPRSGGHRELRVAMLRERTYQFW
jgi:phage-related protein